MSLSRVTTASSGVDLVWASAVAEDDDEFVLHARSTPQIKGPVVGERMTSTV